MSKIIGFATGCIWSWDKSKNISDLLKYVKPLYIDGVELTFSSKEDLYKFKLNNSQINWLKSLAYVSIHAPFRLARNSNNEQEIIKQLDIISELYYNINAKNIVIHPKDLPRPEILKKYKFNVSTENLPKKRNITIDDLKQIFDKYPKMRLCLDVSHAYLWSPEETRKIIDAFKDKISQVHFSGTYRNKDHKSLRIVTERFMYSIEPIKNLNVPIIIEADFKKSNIRFLKDEVKYIRGIFNNI